MEDIPQPSADDKGPEYLSDALIEQQIIDDLLDQLEELRARLQTDEVQTIIDRVLAEHDPDDKMDATAVLLKYGKNVLPEQYYALLEVQDKLLREYGSLVSEHTDFEADDEFASYVRNEAQALLLAVDREKLTEGGYSPEERATIDLAITDLQRLVWELQRSDAMAEAGYDIVEQSRLLLESMQLINSGTTSANQPRSSEVYNHAELLRAADLVRRYRKRDTYLHLDAAAKAALLPIHDWQVTLNDDQRAHLERHLQSIDGEKELAHISIEGVDQLPFQFGELEVQRILRDVPPIILEGLHRIAILKGQSREDEMPLGEEWKELALHSHDLSANSSEITIWLDTINSRYEKMYAQHMEMYKDQPNQERLARAMTNEAARKHLKHTIYHELGHVFHMVLPVSLLHEWDEVAHYSMAGSFVTDYVERVKLLQPDVFDVENLCDVFAMYKLQGSALEASAPDYYDAMRALIASTQRQRRA